MQSISPDYKARKQGQPTMPLKEKCVNYLPAPPDRRPPEGEEDTQ